MFCWCLEHRMCLGHSTSQVEFAIAQVALCMNFREYKIWGPFCVAFH